MSLPVTAEETSPDALRVLIVDDHDLFRTGLRNLPGLARRRCASSERSRRTSW